MVLPIASMRGSSSRVVGALEGRPQTMSCGGSTGRLARLSTMNSARPAATMTPAPASTFQLGTSPNTSQPKITAQTISV